MTIATTELPVASNVRTADELDQPIGYKFEEVIAAIRVHGEELLAFPGVLFIRPGYRFRDGKLTTEPAVVVSVASKQDIPSLAVRDLVPRKLGSVVVDVVPANPKEQLRFHSLRNALLDTASRISLAPPGENGEAEASASFAPIKKYVAPNVPLAAVTEQMTVVCHASPDAGWRILREFLLDTQTRLTSTMYEFNARHVLDVLVEALRDGGRTMNFVLDAGHQQVGSNDVSKQHVLNTLTQQLPGRFRFAWAAVGDDNVTSVAFFKNAYHIKVSVRDGQSFWLSSGNWKRSSQPTTDPIKGPFPPGFDPAEFQRRANREWHVVIHSPALAGLFETYITHDLTQAEQVQLPQPNLAPPLSMPDLFIPAGAPAALLEPPRFFKESEVTGQLTVQPLMTPDNFVDFVLPLIEGATRKLYFQNQSLKPNSDNPRYMQLFRALRDKSRDQNVDVRILVRGDFDAATILSTLQAHNFNMSRIKLQNGNHNKGILVDGKTVLGSHNWTGDGTTFNRDASLIFDDAEIANYYEQLFVYDWDNLSFSDAPELLEMAQIAPPGVPTPAGMLRVSWDDVFSDD
jgi:hypothetical protein